MLVLCLHIFDAGALYEYLSLLRSPESDEVSASLTLVRNAAPSKWLLLKTFLELTMSSNHVPFVWKCLFNLVEAGCYAIAAISLFCYAFQLKDHSGYSMDGVTTIACVATAIFCLFVNNHNRNECKRMHS